MTRRDSNPRPPDPEAWRRARTVGVAFPSARASAPPAGDGPRVLRVLHAAVCCCFPRTIGCQTARPPPSRRRGGAQCEAPRLARWHRRGARSRSRSGGKSRALRRASPGRTACAIVVPSIESVLPESTFPTDPRDADGRAHARAEPGVAGQVRPLRAGMRERGRGAGHGRVSVFGCRCGSGADRVRTSGSRETRKSRLRGSPEATCVASG